MTLVRPASDAASAAQVGPVRSSRIATGWLVVTLVGASAVFLCVLLAHPMWFDEMQAWNIARGSGSLTDLVGNLRYEGHPIGWYLLLYGITRATGDPRAMQALDFVIVVATFALILFRNPFPYLFRLGLVASYFVFFEYGSISRSYSLAVLLLVAILCLLDGDAPRWGTVTALSCALAFTVLSGAVLALALAAVILWAQPSGRGRRVYAAVTAVAVAISALSCIPPSDFRTFAQGLGNTSQFGSGPAVRARSAPSPASGGPPFRFLTDRTRGTPTSSTPPPARSRSRRSRASSSWSWCCVCSPARRRPVAFGASAVSGAWRSRSS